MPKRRRFLGDDNSDDGKRRRKMDVSEICQELLDTIRGHKSEEGRVICEAFIRAPKRRSLADYYEVVSTPMDLCRVQQKIKMEEYEDVEQMSADIELLINNAKTYYKKESQEYQDACEVWNLYNESKNDILGGADDTSSIVGAGDDTLSNPGSEGTLDDDVFEELFSTIMTASDEGRSLSAMFQLLPPKSKYPDYYTIISEPIDLKGIATKIQNNVYQCLSDLERDLLLMVKNAKAYNEPGSQIYRDANTLRKIISNKKTEIDQRKYIPVKTSERIRAKKLLPSGQKWSTITAALKSENESEVDPLANVSL
ncbi:protein polybromo-1-like protein, partial [Leptotrombidium deliense]